MTQSHNHLVIMAGGVGSRFWPMSTHEHPKQFIDVLGVGRTLIQLTLDRFEGVIPYDNVWVVTNELYADTVAEQLPEIPKDHILKEPCRRNTAPCIAYVSWRIRAIDRNANIVVTPADHFVTNPQEFRRIIKMCLEFTAESDGIVTLGMKATRPETGYGYIQADLSSPSARNKEIFRVDSFHEKPNLEKAQQYYVRDDFFWNAGIFIWSLNTIINAFRIYEPQLAKNFEAIESVYGTAEEQAKVNEIYPECENISVDYAIMERAEDIFVCPANFGWSDLGTWGSLLLQSKRDIYGNSLIGNNIDVYDTHNCIIHTMGAKKVVVEGLDGYIVAEENGTLLICRLDQEQRIKQFSGEN